MNLLTYLRVQLAEAKRIHATAATPHLRIFFDGQIDAYADALATAELSAEGLPLVWPEQVAA